MGCRMRLGVERDENEIPLSRLDGRGFDLEPLARKLANLRYPIHGMPPIGIGRTHLVGRSWFRATRQECLDGGRIALAPASLSWRRHCGPIDGRSGKRHGCPLVGVGVDGDDRSGRVGCCRCFSWHGGNVIPCGMSNPRFPLRFRNPPPLPPPQPLAGCPLDAPACPVTRGNAGAPLVTLARSRNRWRPWVGWHFHGLTLGQIEPSKISERMRENG